MTDFVPPRSADETLDLFFTAEPIYLPVPKDAPDCCCMRPTQDDGPALVLFTDWELARAYEEAERREGVPLMLRALTPAQALDLLDEFLAADTIAAVMIDPELEPDHAVQTLMFSAAEVGAWRSRKSG
jgi:hypothetical protein